MPVGSARGVAEPEAIFQIDAATRKAKRIPSRNRQNREAKRLRDGISRRLTESDPVQSVPRQRYFHSGSLGGKKSSGPCWVHTHDACPVTAADVALLPPVSKNT